MSSTTSVLTVRLYVDMVCALLYQSFHEKEKSSWNRVRTSRHTVSASTSFLDDSARMCLTRVETIRV